MKKFILICVLLFAATIARAGGPECAKVIIDGYFAFGGEATAMLEVPGVPALLRQESAAVSVNGQAFCMAFVEAYPVIRYDEELMKEGLALAYAECDWAEEMRLWRDEYNAAGKVVDVETANKRALKVRRWRDQLLKYIQKASEKYMGAEYVRKK
jgi:hypothetical protein